MNRLKEIKERAKLLTFEQDCMLGAKSEFMYLNDALGLIEESFAAGAGSVNTVGE